MDTFLSLAGLGKLKDQQQIALKLHKAFPNETLYLNWALLPMILQAPNRCNGHAGTRSPISVSIAHRCVQTLLDQCVNLKNQSPNHPHSPELEDPNNFWMVLKVLEMVGQSRPEDDHSKIVGIGKLKYPESLFEPLSTADQFKSTTASALSEASTITQLASLSVQPKPNHPIQCRRPQLPEYISLARDDYFKIFDSSLGHIMKTKYLNLELMWRERAIEWANATGLKELIFRLKERLGSDDHNWSTMTTLNQAASNLIRLEEEAGVNEYNLVDQLYLGLNAKQIQKCGERGYALARVDLRCRLRGLSLSDLTDNFHPLSENLDQVVFSYYDQFGEKTCCFDDLAPCLKLLTTEEARNLWAALDQTNQTKENQCLSACEAFVRKQINLEKIRQSLNLTPRDQYATEATRLMKNYFKYLPLGNDLPTTTLQPADGMAILAAQALIEDWDDCNGSVANLYAATYILEVCLAKSAQQYQARSLLIRLHRLLGGMSRSLNLFVGFGIKHIQYDTLSHLGLDRSSIFFSPNLLPNSQDDVQSQPLRVLDLIEYPASFYEYIESDTTTWINDCYMSGNYIKVEDLSFFRHQINVSLQRKVMRMERIRLLLFERTRLSLSISVKNGMTWAGIDSDDGARGWDGDEVEMNLFEVLQDCQSAIDNRDFTVIPDCRSWSPSGTCHQTSLGPMIGRRWLWTLSTTYARIITPQLKFLDHPSLSQPDFFSECSPFEVDLYQYSKTLSTMLQTIQPNLLDSQSQSLVDFFQRRTDEVEALIKPGPDTTRLGKPVPPSQPLAIIHSVYEGLCLFEFAHQQHICGTSSPSKGNKIGKTLRTTRAKIIAQLKTLDVFIHKLLDEMRGQRESPRESARTKCLFASPQIPFPWREEASEDFGTATDWLEQLHKIHLDQRDTLAGWHALVKLFL